MTSAFDRQEGGSHYADMGEYQPWKVLPHWLTPDEMRGFAKGTVIAYLARERAKGGIGDIRKALHTLELFLTQLDGEEELDIAPIVALLDETVLQPPAQSHAQWLDSLPYPLDVYERYLGSRTPDAPTYSPETYGRWLDSLPVRGEEKR